MPLCFVSSQQRFGVMDIKAPPGMSQLSGLGQTVLQLLDKSVLQLRITALFYLQDRRKIHLWGVRARQSKDVKRRAPHHTGEREGEEPLTPLFICFFLPPGPVLCKLGLGRNAVLPEVLTLVLGPPFDLLLFYFPGLFLSLSFSHHHFGLLFLILTT